MQQQTQPNKEISSDTLDVDPDFQIVGIDSEADGQGRIHRNF